MSNKAGIVCGDVVYDHGTGFVGIVQGLKPAMLPENEIAHIVEPAGTVEKHINTCYLAKVDDELLALLASVWHGRVSAKVDVIRKKLKSQAEKA